LPHAA